VKTFVAHHYGRGPATGQALNKLNRKFSIGSGLWTVRI